MTEPVDVVLVVTGRVLHVVGGLLPVCTGVVVVLVCVVGCALSSMIVLMVVVE